MRHLEHPDRREQERRRQRAPEELDGEITPLCAAQHARHDVHAFECGPVRRHRRLEPCATRDIGEAFARHRALRVAL
jgi:hypothetical protein